MGKRRQKRLFGEFVGLVIASLIIPILDPLVAGALNHAAQTSPPTVAPLWELLAIVFSFHLEVVAAWLIWVVDLLGEIKEQLS